MKLKSHDEHNVAAKTQKKHRNILAEVKRLAGIYQARSDYNFEYQSKMVRAKFINAWVQINSYPTNAYRIHLVVPPKIVVVGKCFIEDGEGKRIEGFALTILNNLENAVIIRTTLSTEPPNIFAPFHIHKILEQGLKPC